MALVTLTVGGRRYELACRDGEEAHLQQLAAVVDGKAADAGRVLGPTNESRQLLLASLMLADQLADRTSTRSSIDDPTEGLAEALETLAKRVEKLADALENGAASA